MSKKEKDYYVINNALLLDILAEEQKLESDPSLMTLSGELITKMKTRLINAFVIANVFTYYQHTSNDVFTFNYRLLAKTFGFNDKTCLSAILDEVLISVNRDIKYHTKTVKYEHFDKKDGKKIKDDTFHKGMKLDVGEVKSWYNAEGIWVVATGIEYDSYTKRGLKNTGCRQYRLTNPGENTIISKQHFKEAKMFEKFKSKIAKAFNQVYIVYDVEKRKIAGQLGFLKATNNGEKFLELKNKYFELFESEEEMNEMIKNERKGYV